MKRKTELQKIREFRGMSRKELSEQSGVNFRSLQDYEQEHKEIFSAKSETLYKLSCQLGCTMEDLLVSSVDPKQQQKRLSYYYEFWKERHKQNVHDGRYYLMHQDDVVALLVMDEVTGSLLSVETIYDERLIPLGGNHSMIDLQKWWERRAVPIQQGNIRMLLSNNQIATTQSYLLQNLGLSLTDHYWLNPYEHRFCWGEVNLFVNDFRDEFGNYQFSDSVSSENCNFNLKRRNAFFPSASLQGELQKKWIIKDGKRYLIKGNYGQSYQQSVNEVIATLLHRKQEKINYTTYELCDITVAGEKTLGCVCEDFCTEDVEFVSAYDVIESEKKKNEQSVYEHFIDVCQIHGLKSEEVRCFLEYQILSDFILTNIDRHLYNFGVLRNTKSLEFIGMAPIFDSGNSLFVNRRNIPQSNQLLSISVNSFKKKEIDLLKYVQNPGILDINKLPTKNELQGLLELDLKDVHRVSDIIKAYQCKIKLLDRLQHGEKIYQYGYRYE